MNFSELRMPAIRSSSDPKNTTIDRQGRLLIQNLLVTSFMAAALFAASSAAAQNVDKEDSNRTNATSSKSRDLDLETDDSQIRLQSNDNRINRRNGADQTNANGRNLSYDQEHSVRPAPKYIPSEFERYVQNAFGEKIKVRRFGTELMTTEGQNGAEQQTTRKIPDDYLISIGDEVLVTLWGSVDADLRLNVDRSGRVTIPRVGPVMVAGLSYSELAPAIERRVSQVFRNFKLAVSLGRLRDIRVYITGFTQRPGAYTVSGLSTIVNALMQVGGPSAAGSFRKIELKRNGKTISNFDLYELLIKGDKSADKTLLPDDVIHIDAVGAQVAMIGSVNKPAIFELKPKDTFADILAMAGGFTAVADRTRLTLERLEARQDVRVEEVKLPLQEANKPRNGDLLRAFSAVEVKLPQEKQSKRVKVEGEVRHPGEFVLPANSRITDAIQAAGGLTSGAYLFGANFSRESVRVSQQENYDRALRDMETEFTRNTSTQRTSNADEAAAQDSKSQASTRLIDRLRAIKPTGRVVLQIAPTAKSLPDLAIEDGDQLLIPSKPNTVGVYGSVFNGGSYLYSDGGAITDFLKLAGGPTRGADKSSIFVVRANGSVVSALQKSGWIFSGGGLEGLLAQPGDTVFVPEEMNKTNFMQDAKDWSQIFSQFGLGVAAIKTLKN